jgi:acetylornithine deacetylase/succinyl-diaminopimelate desuccinylase-like protein
MRPRTLTRFALFVLALLPSVGETSAAPAAAAAPATPSVAAQGADAIRAWRMANDARLLASYREFLAIPNVAADREGLARTAQAIVDRMSGLGLAPRLLRGSSPNAVPAVFGEWKVPGATRTIVYYAHYDGQPIGNRALWTRTEPFTPRLLLGDDEFAAGVPVPDDARLYARSASDDKLGVFAFLAAIEGLKATGSAPSVNAKFFFEGEEEAGSPHLPEILSAHRELLASDGWVIVDGPSHPTGPPQVVFGVRGDSNVAMTLYGPLRPLHSGHYGNWVPNPGMELARLLASMKDDSGRVTIDGWYDDVVALGDVERRAIAAAPSADAALAKELAISPEGGGRPLLELLLEPSLNVNGMKSGDVGEQARNVIPTEASAVLDLRLVKGNDAKRQFAKLVRHVERRGFTVIDHAASADERRANPRLLTMTQSPGSYNASRTAMDLPLSRAVVAAVASVAVPVELPALGGSLPLVHFNDLLGAPTITVSFANHDNNQHAENENLRVGHWRRGIEVAAALLRLPAPR